MTVKVVHITTVHHRHDVRVRYKYCVTLARDKAYEACLMVADGLGPETVEGLRIIDVGKPILGRVGRFVIGSFKVLRALRKQKADILHFHDPELLFVAFILKIAGKKVVFDMHENLPLQLLTKTYIPLIFRHIISKVVAFLQWFSFHYIPVIFAETSYVNYFSSVKHSEVILNFPLKIVSMINAKKKMQFTLGYIGHVNRERGALSILKAIKKLRENNVPAHVIFVGHCAEEIKQTTIFKESSKEGWAEFTGRMNPREGWAIMAQCHAGLAVLQPSPNFLESYPTKLFEYMLLGLPVIISDFPMYKEIVEKASCGIAVNPESEEEITAAITRLFNHPDEAVSMGVRGKKTATENYNWESEYAKLNAFYNTIRKT